MRYFVDTNIFLRTLIKENEKSFTECYRFLQAVKTNKIKAVTSTIILAEIVWTLSSYYIFPKEKITQAIRSIINLRGLKIIDKFNHLKAIELFEKKQVKYIDTLISSMEKISQRQWIVVSFDHDFDKLGITRKEPKEIS